MSDEGFPDLFSARATPDSESDPLVDRFLAFLERDSIAHPEHIQAVTPAMVARVRSFVEGVQIDLDAPLNDDDE